VPQTGTVPTSDGDIFPFTPYKSQKSENDGLSGRNFSGGSLFPDNKAFRKLCFARCLKK
jgi:hypothetical protein